MTRPRVLMPVYNGIEYDGRVRRAAAAIAEDADVTVVSLRTNGSPVYPDFAVRTVAVPPVRRSKLSPHLRFWAGVLREAIRIRPTVVHAHDYFLALPGWLVARAMHARFVYDAHELSIPSPGVAMTARERFWYYLEAIAVRRADVVIAANKERAALMQLHYQLREEPVVVKNVPPRPVEAPLPVGFTSTPTPGTTRAVRLVYQGDVALERGLGDFVETVIALGPPYELLIIGGGPDALAVASMADDPRAGNRVRLLGRVPAADLPALMRGCDLGVVCYPQRGWNNIYCAPNKLFEYAQAGVPMVATPNPVLEAAFANYGIGIAGADLPRVIVEAARRRDELAAGLGRFLQENTWEGEAAALRRGYASVMDGGRRRAAK